MISPFYGVAYQFIKLVGLPDQKVMRICQRSLKLKQVFGRASGCMLIPLPVINFAGASHIKGVLLRPPSDSILPFDHTYQNDDLEPQV
jgi:hypothetical protein